MKAWPPAIPKRRRFLSLVVFGAVEDPGPFRQIGHSFLRERGPDDIAGQVFHGGYFSGQDAGAAKDLKSGKLPKFQQINMDRKKLLKKTGLFPNHQAGIKERNLRPDIVIFPP
jgi:hypothetical protein